MSYCAPNVYIEDKYTCFTKEELVELANAFNIYVQTILCETGNKPCKFINTKGSKQQIWNRLFQTLNDRCSAEYCWIIQPFVKYIYDKNLKDKLLEFTFKPISPKGRHQWLRTQDINAVLQQYQEFDKSFKFIGALPSDFYTQVKGNYHQIPFYKHVAIVFNLDKHNQPGSHWTALFIDNTRKSIEYFDSAGKPPNKYIRIFIDYIQKVILKNYQFMYNTIVHQRKNSECGIYAIYFVIQRLLGSPFEKITQTIIPDSEMNVFRDYIFRPPVD